MWEEHALRVVTRHCHCFARCSVACPIGAQLTALLLTQRPPRALQGTLPAYFTLNRSMTVRGTQKSVGHFKPRPRQSIIYRVISSLKQQTIEDFNLFLCVSFLILLLLALFLPSFLS